MAKAKRFKVDRDAAAYDGPYRPYDILKEGTIAFIVIYAMPP